LGFAQRTIHASRSDIPPKRKPKKPIPATLKTLGDHIQFARLKAGLPQSKLAEKLGVTTMEVKLWEEDLQAPNESQWAVLARALGLRESSSPKSPTVEQRVGHLSSKGECACLPLSKANCAIRATSCRPACVMLPSCDGVLRIPRDKYLP
jgi:DNA-binding transcriptional regulator YiaG